MEQRVKKIVAWLRKAYPRQKITLKNGNTLELLIAVMLSAQCTDAQVNKVTPELFKRFKTARDFAKAEPKTLENLIHSTGFYRNKAKNIRMACKLIDEKFGGKVPKTMEGLLELPGVARKTANIVLTAGYGIVDGIPVDTHVLRLSQRLGLTANKNPEKIERDLMAAVPKAEWWGLANRLIAHGRTVCSAKKPNCAGCGLNKICPSSEV